MVVGSPRRKILLEGNLESAIEVQAEPFLFAG